MAIKISLDAYARYLGRIAGELPTAARRGLLSAAYRTQAKAQDATRQAPPASHRGSPGAVSTGNYLRSWKVAPTERGAVLRNWAPYAGIIERGRRAGAPMPPPQALARWAQLKLGLSRKEAESAGWAMAREIARRGLRPRRVLASVMPFARRFAREEVIREVEALVAKVRGR